MTGEPENPGIELMRQFVANSPFAGKLGIEIVALELDRAHLRLPFDPSLATVGEVVHGGAIAALADTAATAACWTGVDVAGTRGGATISLTVDYVDAAAATALDAHASVLRRGRSICFAEVRVLDQQGDLVASVLVTYRFRGDGARS
jgi:uncharacterized protein (TIGR00369 family)